MFIMSIPEISDEKLLKMYSHIKPVVRINGKLHWLREYTLDELKHLSFLFERFDDVRDEVDENELEVLTNEDFICLSKFGYDLIFNPTVAEVFAQIKNRDNPFIVAFEIVGRPCTPEDLTFDSFTSIAHDNNFHVFTVRLYTKSRV